MIDSIKISVVIPTYNPPVERFIACIKSILNQNFDEYEIIVYDDGSDSEVADSIARISEMDSRIRLLRGRHAGVSQARNQATLLARGTYVIYADSDDEVPSYTLARVWELAEKTDADVIMGMTQYIKSDAEKKECSDGVITYYTGEEITKLVDYHLIGRLKGLPTTNAYGAVIKVGPVARAVRRSLAVDTPFPEGIPISEDTIWNIELLIKTNMAVIVGDTWYWYWVINDSSSHSYRENAYQEATKIIQKLILLWRENNSVIKPESMLARVIGEINRLIKKNHARSECTLTFREKSQQIDRLVSIAEDAGLSSASVASKGGIRELVKYLLIKTKIIEIIVSIIC